MPVVFNYEKWRVAGILTDCDITCRVVTAGCSTVTPEMSVEECCRIMADKRVRQFPVVDAENACCGIVTVTDLMTYNLDNETLLVVKQVSWRK